VVVAELCDVFILDNHAIEAASHSPRFSGLLSLRTHFVMNLLESLERPTEHGCDDLGVFCDVAVLSSVRMLRFED
jgi:hypothetical protein